MRLTSTHLAYWQSRRVPDWASGLIGPRPSIDDVINTHAAPDFRQRKEPALMLAILRQAKANAGLLPALQATQIKASLYRMAGPAIEAPTGYQHVSRRAANARRWLKKIGVAYGQEQTDSTEIGRALPGFSNPTLSIGRRSNSLATLLQAHRYQAHRNDA